MTHPSALPSRSPSPVARPLPRDFADHGPCAEDVALTFAQHDADTAEALIAVLVTQAVRQWRLDDATFWQRVKFKARMIRATARHAPDAADDRRDDGGNARC